MTTTEPGAPGHDSHGRLFLYGSCVSRDSAELFPKDGFALLHYVARQSLISALSPTPATLDLTRIESPFQRRMLDGDAKGNLPALLEHAQEDVDLVVWDLTDERLGVMVSPEGRVITRSVEGISAGIIDELTEWRLVDFGSDEHFALWTDCLGRFADLLRRLDLLERTVLLRVPWAERSDDGTPVPASFGLSSALANQRYERYYAAARRAEITIEALDPAVAVTSSTHRWGAAPFHYAETTYREVVHRVMQHLAAPRSEPFTDR